MLCIWRGELFPRGSTCIPCRPTRSFNGSRLGVTAKREKKNHNGENKKKRVIDARSNNWKLSKEWQGGARECASVNSSAGTKPLLSFIFFLFTLPPSPQDIQVAQHFSAAQVKAEEMRCPALPPKGPAHLILKWLCAFNRHHQITGKLATILVFFYFERGFFA